MPLLVTAFEATPNPNAIKCLVDPPPSDRVRSYFNARQAAEDPLALALFGIPGVTNVLIHTTFITLCKTPETPWPGIKSAIKKVLRDHA